MLKTVYQNHVKLYCYLLAAEWRSGSVLGPNMVFRSSAFRFEKTEQLSFRQERTNSRICKSQFRKLYEKELLDVSRKQSGAVEACWAHNPEVRRSKPRSANLFISYSFFYSHIL